MLHYAVKSVCVGFFCVFFGSEQRKKLYCGKISFHVVFQQNLNIKEKERFQFKKKNFFLKSHRAQSPSH